MLTPKVATETAAVSAARVATMCGRDGTRLSLNSTNAKAEAMKRAISTPVSTTPGVPITPVIRPSNPTTPSAPTATASHRRLLSRWRLQSRRVTTPSRTSAAATAHCSPASASVTLASMTIDAECAVQTFPFLYHC
jgi:hypothetical protein